MTAVFLPTVNLSADEPSRPLTELQIFSTLDDDMAAPHKAADYWSLDDDMASPHKAELRD